MKIAVRLALLAAVAGLGFWLWTVFFPAPEKVVRGKLASLAATATFTANDSNLTRAGKAAKVVEFFSPEAQIIFAAAGQGGRSLSGREEIREAALGGFASIPALKVEFLDATVFVSADKLAAEVSCTARVFIGDQKDSGVQEMHFQFQKVDGVWRITRAETVNTLS